VTRGKAAYLAFEACINQAFGCIRPDETVNEWYLFYSLDNSYEALRAFSQGSNQKNLNCQLLARFQIPVPTKPDQEKLVARFRLIDAKLDAIQAHREITGTLKSRLIASVMT